MENGYSLADISAATDGMNGSNSFIWIFALVILMGMFNGNGFNNNFNYDRPATQSDVSNLQQFGQILDGNRDILNQISMGNANVVNTINQSTLTNIATVKDAQLQLQDRLSDLHTSQQAALANQNQCCSTTRMEIANQAAGINQNLMQNRYEAALNTAAVTEAINSGIQKVLDNQYQDKVDAMQNQINELQLAQATNGMLKYPSAWTFSAGPFNPWCNCSGAM